MLFEEGILAMKRITQHHVFRYLQQTVIAVAPQNAGDLVVRATCCPL